MAGQDRAERQERRDALIELLESAQDDKDTDHRRDLIATAQVLAVLYLADTIELRSARGGFDLDDGPGPASTPDLKKPAKERPARPQDRRDGAAPCDSLGRITSLAEPTTFIESVRVECQLEAGHDGSHVFHVEWSPRT